MKIIVLGAGASGMMAACTAAEEGHDVTLIEKNDIPGRKIFITGKGRCNVTNDSPVEDLLLSVPHNPEFLYSAFYTFPSQDLMDYLRKGGLKLKTERGKRVFPESDKSSDVIKFFRRQMENLGVNVIYSAEVLKIKKTGDRITSLLTSKGEFSGDYFIVCGGGGSYPLTGSSGEILKMMEALGIKTHPFKPSLIPLVLKEDVSDLAGLSLKNVGLDVMEGKKKVFSEIGEMLFTHDGISGPLVLSASSYINRYPAEIVINLKPGLDRQMTEKKILGLFSDNPNKSVENALTSMSLSKLVNLVIERSGTDRNKKVNSVTREERNKITEGFNALKFTATGTRPLSEAIISRGGIDVREIDPSTMKIKKYENLSVAGEIVDTDALTGGFNLQIAFSTGYLAGKYAEIS